MPAATTLTVFVFPLENMVFYPSTTVPLNIFEPRYVQMVNDALDRGTPIALAGEDPTEVGHPVVAGMGLPRLLHRRDDGTMVILVQGRAKVRTAAVVQEKPYIVCEAEVIEEERHVASSNRALAVAVTRRLSRWVEAHVPAESDRAYIRERMGDPAMLCELAATLALKDATLKQLLLETDDVNMRLAMLRALFGADGKPLGAADSAAN